MKKTLLLAISLLALCFSANAQMIPANNYQTMPRTYNGQSSTYRPTGSYLRLEAGYKGLSVGYAYQLEPYMMIGGGFGWYWGRDYVDGIHDHGMPFFEVRYSTPQYTHSFFADLKVGYKCLGSSKDGFAALLEAGYMYKNLSFGLGIGVSPYYDNYWYDDLTDVFPFISIGYNLPLRVSM